MTPAQFNEWLAAMKSAGLAKSDADCGRQLGVSTTTIIDMKANGASGYTAKRTSLACAALLAGLKPYGSE